MTIVLELKSEVEARIKALAAAQGVSVKEYVLIWESGSPFLPKTMDYIFII
jgi:hypothetical protein